MPRIASPFSARARSPDELAGGTSVVIDVLRATTTIVYALAAGAGAVIPCLTIEDARAVRASFPVGAGRAGRRARRAADRGI